MGGEWRGGMRGEGTGGKQGEGKRGECGEGRARRTGADHFPLWRFTCIHVIQALQGFSAKMKLINK